MATDITAHSSWFDQNQRYRAVIRPVESLLTKVLRIVSSPLPTASLLLTSSVRGPLIGSRRIHDSCNGRGCCRILSRRPAASTIDYGLRISGCVFCTLPTVITILVAPASLLIYDYLLTIYAEVRLVWFSPWTYTKVLFLLTRYIPISNIYFYLHDQLAIDASLDLCTTSRSVNTWLPIIGIIFAETILMIRTWAVWRRDWRIGLFLLAIVIGTIVSSSVDASQFLKSLTSVPPLYSGFRGCFVSGKASSLLQSFVTLTIMDAVVLALMILSAFRSYRSGHKSELSNVVHRDAISFYVYLLLCSTGSVIVARLWPLTLMTLLVPLQSALHSILACRIFFNIRSVALRASTGATIGLHSDYREMGLHFENCTDSEDLDTDIVLATRVDYSSGTTSYSIS